MAPPKQRADAGRKQARVEEALAKMRAAQQPTEEPPCGVLLPEELEGFVFDADRRRYFPSNNAAALPNAQKKHVHLVDDAPRPREVAALRLRSEVLLTRSPVDRRRKVERALATSRIAASVDDQSFFSQNVEGIRGAAMSEATGTVVTASSRGLSWDGFHSGGDASCVTTLEGRGLVGGCLTAGVLTLWDLEAKREVFQVQAPLGGAELWCVDAHKTAVAVGGANGRVRLVDVETGQGTAVSHFNGRSSDCLALALEGGQRVLCGARNGAVDLRDVRRRGATTRVAKVPGAVDDLHFIDDDIVVADRHSTIERYDLRMPLAPPVASLRGHEGHGAVASKLFTDSTFCAAGGKDGAIRLWRWFGETTTPLAEVTVEEERGALLIAAKYDDGCSKESSDLPSFLLSDGPRNNDDDLPRRRRLKFVSRASGRAYALAFRPPA